MNGQQEWARDEEVNVSALTEAVTNLRAAKDDYSEAKGVSDGKYATVKEKEHELINLLEKARITEYIAEGVGKVKVKVEDYVTTPKSPEEKKAFFTWIKMNMGDAAHDAYLNVNSQSLQTLFKEQTAMGKTIAGLTEPRPRTKLSLTKSRA